MGTTSPRTSDLGRSGSGLFIALVVVSAFLTFSMPLESATPFRIALLIAAGVLYTVIGLFGSGYVERAGTPLTLSAYFGVQLVLGATIVYLSETRGWLLLLPVAAGSVELLPRPWMIVVCVLSVLAVVVPSALIAVHVVALEGELADPLFAPEFWEALLTFTLPFLMGFAFVILYMLAGEREKKAHAEVERLAEELQEANRQLREYAAQAEELATVHERNRLAREIHDGLGHYLTGINMQIQAGRAVLDVDREVALDALDQAQALAQEGLTEVRRSVAALRASPLDNQSLSQAIESLVNECRAAGIATAFTVRGDGRDLPPQVELALYRVAQEGMTNMRKHAQSSSAEVELDFRDEDQIRLTVCDSGVGTDDPSGGYGLVGVRERVHLLGGQVHIETAPGEGFTLQVQVPAELSSLAAKA
jgi:signal transduction histidine kinase